MAVRQNYSRKRAAILDCLQSTTVHPTAEWVYDQLKPEYPDLSLGTVYRNIKKFCLENKVRSVGVIQGQEHFDANMSEHSHLVCEECGKIIDIDDVFFTEEYLGQISTKYGVNIQREDVVFKGSCNNCI